MKKVRVTLRKLFLLSFFGVLSSSSLPGCARSRPAPLVRAPFQVSVSAGGRPVADLDSRLIHRLDYSPTVSERVSSLKVGVERDREGKVMGLRVKNGSVIALGLELGDLITAINLRRVEGESDLQSLKSSLSRGEDISMTVERERVAHKIYLSLKR